MVSSKASLPGAPGFPCKINKPNYSGMFTTYLMLNSTYKDCWVACAQVDYGRAGFS